MKYAVCSGKTVTHGIAKKVGNGTVVETKTFNAGSLIDLKDDAEHKRLLDAGVIRSLEEFTEEENSEESTKTE